jgi:hypothetical protein
MQLPPGPLYLLRILLRALPVTVAVYGALCLQAGHLSTITPSSFVVLALAYPVLVYTRGYWSAYQDRVDAAAREAVLVPRVAERGLKIRAGLVNSIQSGYPGACCAVGYSSRTDNPYRGCLSSMARSIWRNIPPSIFGRESSAFLSDRFTRCLLTVFREGCDL